MAEALQDRPSGSKVSTPAGDWAFVPSALPPALNWTPPLVAALSEADRALGELAGMGRVLSPSELGIGLFLRREAVLSSRIAGLRASIAEVYACEADRRAQPEVSPRVDAVVRLASALERGLERLAEVRPGLDLLREAHARMMEGQPGPYQGPGMFRRQETWLGRSGPGERDARYVPPPVKEMGRGLVSLERFVRADSTMPKLVRLGLAQYQLEAIHPFMHGNGRIARLLVTLLLRAWGLLQEPVLCLSAWFEARQEKYFGLLLAVSERSAWEDWLVYFLEGVAHESRDAMERIGRLRELRERHREKVQGKRATARLVRVVEMMHQRPVLTVQAVQETLGISCAAAQRQMEALAELGMLREVTGQARKRLYVADEVVNLMENDLDGG